MFENLYLHSRFFSQRVKTLPPSRHQIGRGLVAFLLLLPLLLFNSSAVQAQTGPTLTINVPNDEIHILTTIHVMGDATFTLPISFEGPAETNEISAVSFSLVFDRACLTFDNITDTNADGMPDAITGLPVNYNSTVSYVDDGIEGKFDVSIIDQRTEQIALPDGLLIAFEFGVEPSCRTADDTPVDGNLALKSFTFGTTPAPTFGNVEGDAVAGGTHTDGNLTLRFNATPTDIALSNLSINENVPLGTTVGALSSTDFDSDQPRGDSHTYSLVACDDCADDDDNGSFTILVDELKSNTALDFETKSSYSVLVRTTDSYGGTFDKAFTISVVDVNEAPTSLTIDSSSVNENAAVGTVVGLFSSLDVDIADVSVDKNYSLLTGSVGPLDNASFTIVGRELRTAAVFNYEVKKSYNIHVRVTDTGGLTFDNIFTINVVDINDAPVAVNDDIDPQVEVITGPKILLVLANDTDEDRPPNPLTVVEIGDPDPLHGTAVASGDPANTAILFTPVVGYNGPVAFTYKAHDGTDPSDLPANVTFRVVASITRGDCNADGAVNAGDFPALVLELNDTANDSPNWYDAHTGSFAGSPMGCDANNDKSITVADLTCTVLASFGDNTCTLLTAQAASTLADADLAVGQNLVGVPNSTVNVPIRLTTNDHRVAAASFALNFDRNQLVFDATDADQNGLPDAVTFSTPPGMVTVANYNEAASRLELTVYAVSVPMATLSDGLVASVTFTVNAETTVVEAPIVLVNSSLGSDQGQAVPVEVHSASVRVVQTFRSFLPLLSR